MSPKKRLRNTLKGVVNSSQESDAAHVATTITTIDAKATSGGCYSNTLCEPAVCNVTSDERSLKAHGTAEQKGLPSVLEGLLLRSSVIAPDVAGIRCVAIHPSEREMVLVRENGSIILYGIDSFQNVPHFEQLRHTGGRANRTITRIRYLPCEQSFLLASYLSGQLVLYCGETLTPLHIHQRTGGAIWDFCIVGTYIYTAMADGSWQQLFVDYDRALPTLTLQRIIPKVSGADRALSVCCSQQWAIAAGTDDAGNVVAWRLPREEEKDDEENKTKNNKNKNNNNFSFARSTGLSGHEALWTSRLPKGMALCCAISSGTNGGSPVVAVGTSMGDVVLFDAQHGHVLKTFTHHKGPVSTIVSDNGVFYASGWHESLRSYRCGMDNEWFPAEVKRRTHYHEASELLILKQHQLLLSASRDGTVMYAPLDSVFTSPAMYISVTTQQFAFAKSKNILLQTRRGRIEGFRTDNALRHWVPLFAHRIHGKFHLQGLWCDEQLHYIFFATDERAALLHVCWKDGAEDALALRRIEEAVALPVGRGVLDCCFVSHGGHSSGGETISTESCYVLLDNAILHITLAEGYPVVSTAIQTTDGEAFKNGIRPIRLLVNEESHCTITVCGLRGRITCCTAPDGTIDPSSFVWNRESTRMVSVVPALRQHTSRTFVALTNGIRYVAGLGTSSPCSLPRTLPHDVRFIARLPSGDGEANGKHERFRFLAFFTRGLLYVSENSWRMVHRCTVEAAFVLKDDERVLVLVRNLEGTLEALPLCWKVRRFGN